MSEEMYEVVGETIREVIGSDIHEMRVDIKEIKERLTDVEGSVERIDRKVDVLMERGDRHRKKIQDLDERVTLLETPKS